MLTGASMVHVPYRGAGPALTALLGAQVQVYFSPLSAAIEHIKTGNLRALAVTTANRSEALADPPTVSEFVPDYEASNWYSIGAPRNTPAEIIDKLNRAINADQPLSPHLCAAVPTAAVTALDCAALGGLVESACGPCGLSRKKRSPGSECGWGSEFDRQLQKE